jgi:hypothetical protein
MLAERLSDGVANGNKFGYRRIPLFLEGLES